MVVFGQRRSPTIRYVAVPGFDDAHDRAFDALDRIDHTGRVTVYSYGSSHA